MDRGSHLIGVNDGRFEVYRRDFRTTTHCAFCTHELSSGLATILHHPQHGEVSSGPTCARDRVNPWPKSIVTMYGGLVAPIGEGGEPALRAKHTGHEPDPEPKTPETPAEIALRYLYLRCEQLPGLKFDLERNDSFEKVWRAVQSKQASRNDLVWVAGRIGGPKIAGTIYSPSHLLKLYQAARMIDQARSAEPHRLKSESEKLRLYKKLFPSEIHAINRVIARQFPTLYRLPETMFESDPALPARPQARRRHQSPA